ncbi:MAG: MauE/DoxX family redox-associated membrane protein [Acidimicrobiia bacterium]
MDSGSVGSALLVVGARCALAGTFAAAAWSKLRQQSGFAASLALFGVPEALRRPLSRSVPATEALCAVSLLVWMGSPWPAWLSLGLLAALSAGVTANLVAGRRPPCPCFRATGQQPISGATLIRNAALLALAVVATGSSGGAPMVLAGAVGVVSGATALAAASRLG